ncbi:MAG: hypothetical protein HY922_16430 [Elusimicrobia bacterium]|nr:hypothetical protein [Elusimicrobiota bacterium]
MPDRRQAYLAFQGLLTVILLLFFLFQRTDVENWALKFFFLTGTLLGALALLRGLPAKRLAEMPIQSGLLLGDAVLASLTLYWTQNPQSDLYLTYFMIILGAALSRKLAQCFLVAVAASVFYVFSSWTPAQGLARDPAFWLRLPFLWVMAFLAALLSQDAQQIRRESERAFQGQLLQMEKLASLGQMAAEVAHRIKGPLTSILVTAEVLQRRHGARALQSELGDICSEALRCREILKKLLRIGRIEETVFQQLDLREPVRSAIDSARPQLIRHKIRLRLKGLGRPAQIIGDHSLLHEAVFSILQNAVEAMPKGGRLELRLRAVGKRAWWSLPGEALDFFELIVADTGGGFGAKAQRRLFEPFFTTKNRSGSGLGLCAAQRILHNHSGYIEAASDGPGKGSRFTISVPRFEKIR